MQAYNLREQELVIRMERLFSEADKRVSTLQRLTAATQGAMDGIARSIVNLLDNTDFDRSKDNFLNNPLLGGDIDFECFNFFRHLKTDAQLFDDAAHALKSSGHSLYAANEGANSDIPRWNRVDGWAEIGSVGATLYDLACPLPENFVRPGLGKLHVQFIASRRTTNALPAGVQAYAGIWDNTAGQRKWIEGDAFALTHSVVGATGATTREFKVIGLSDYGAQIESNVVTVNNSPAALTPANYVRLNMSGAPGFIQFDIYEKVGGTVFLIGQIFNSIDVAFNHTGAHLRTEGASFPTVTDTKAKAYAETDDFEITSGVWSVFDFTIPIPPTYNVNNTTDRQWFRFGLKTSTADERQVLLDRLGVSLGFGDWAPSARRPANVNPSSSMTGSTQGPPPGGGEPPDDGSGGPRCWVIEGSEIATIQDGKEVSIPFDDLLSAMRVVSDSLRPNSILRVRRDFVDETILVETENGLSRRFTTTHRLRKDVDNVHGTPVGKLKVGDTVVTRLDGNVEITTISKWEPVSGRVEVGSIALGPGHWFWLNGFASHNAKTLFLT
jgi:hypothetical protein